MSEEQTTAAAETETQAPAAEPTFDLPPAPADTEAPAAPMDAEAPATDELDLDLSLDEPSADGGSEEMDLGLDMETEPVDVLEELEDLVFVPEEDEDAVADADLE